MALRLIIAFLCCWSAHAATNVASSLAYSDVASAVAASSSGDVVVLPAGEATWPTNKLAITTRIRLIGAGAGLTTLKRGTETLYSSNYYMVTFSGQGTDYATPYGVSGITFDEEGSDTSYALLAMGTSLSSTNRYWRVTGCEFLNVKKRGIAVQGRSEGVIDNNYFTCPYNASAQALTILGFQRASAQVTNSANATGEVSLGTTNDFVYVENNRFNYAYDNDSMCELYWDAQAVVRYNYGTNCSLGVHENGMSRAATVWEYYGNFISSTNGSGTVAWLGIRSGWGVVYSNTILTTYPSFDDRVRLKHYRASGTNVFAAYPVGYYPNNSVTGTNRFDGNTNTIVAGYPAMDQCGWGDPTVWFEDHGAQTFHGVYGWSNTVNGAESLLGPFDFCATSESVTNCNQYLEAWDGSPLPDTKMLIVEGRDFFNDTPKPGYIALPYPHPLVTVQNAPTNRVNLMRVTHARWGN